MAQTFEVTAELTDDRHLTLDEPIQLPAGKVRVVVEPLVRNPKPDLETFFREMHARQKARGHVPPTKEEVDAYINAERDSWDS